jgi:hypothetical protein
MIRPEKPQDDLEILLDALLEELMSMSSVQVLDGEAPAAVQAKGLAMLSAAKQQASKRRLANAKAGLALVRADVRASNVRSVSAAQAKAFLREAANSGNYTMAARQLDEMSDQAALSLYNKLVRLGVVPPVEEDSG